MKRVIGLVMLCAMVLLASAQTFEGKITDEQGEPVPYAALYIRELKWGFTADDNGRFQTSLKSGAYNCEVSSLGYDTQLITFRITSSGLERNIKLKERIYSLREVSVVKGAEDPAYAVMRKAISRAPYYRTQIKEFKAGTYLKGTGKGKAIPAILNLSKEVREDSKKYLGKLFLLEEQREVSFKSPDKWENRVKAYSNTFPDEFQVSIGLTTINLYQPTIFDKVSPLSVGAFSYYRYKLEGCYSEGNHLVNKIKVIPKMDNPRLVSGTIYVIEDLWCLSAADIAIRSGGMKATVKVTCKEVQPSVFMVTSMSTACTIDVMGFKAEASYLAAIHYTSVVTGSDSAGDEVVEASASAPRILSKKQQKLKQQIETLSSKEDLTMGEAYKLSRLVEKSFERRDTLHSGDKYERKPFDYRKNVSTDSLAGKKDSLYWAAVRSVPLKPEELQSYIDKQKLSLQKDSLQADSVRKKGEQRRSSLEVILLGKTFKTPQKSAWLTLYGLSSYIPEYNFVDGFWLGARMAMGVKLARSASMRFEPSFYYTTARKAFVGEGKLMLDYAPRYKGQWMVAGGISSVDFNGEAGESRWVNGIASSFFGRNEVKLYEKRYVGMEHRIELANSLLLTTSASWQQRRELENNISQSWFKRQAESNVPDHPYYQPMPRNDAFKVSLSLEYTPARYYRMIAGKKEYDESKFPIFRIRYDKAFPVGNKQLSPSYQFAEFSVSQNIELDVFNRLVWSVNGGKFWDVDRIYFPDFKHFATTRIPVTERTFDTGFSLLDNYALSTDLRWIQGNVSWYAPRLFLKFLPFLKRKSFDEALHLRSILLPDRNPYWEVGYSIGFSSMARAGVFLGFDRMHYRSVGVSLSLPLSVFKEGVISL